MCKNTGQEQKKKTKTDEPAQKQPRGDETHRELSERDIQKLKKTDRK